MGLSSAKFAFQIDATQSFKHIDTSSEKIVASKKSSVTLQDGSTKKMTIFFAADKNTVIDMQNKGLARSNQQTMNDFKRFCMSSQKGLSSAQFAKSMRNVKDMFKSQSINTKNSFSDQLRIDYDTHMQVPYAVFAGKFVAASQSGILVRVNNEGVETSYKNPEKKTEDLTTDEIKRFGSKYGGNHQALETADPNPTPATMPDKPSDITTDRAEKMPNPPQKRHAISREKHITQRRVDISDPFVSPKPSTTQTAPGEAMTRIADADSSSGKTP